MDGTGPMEQRASRRGQDVRDDAGLLDAASSNPRMGGASFSFELRIKRVVFGVVWLLLARWTPPQLRSWRRLLLNAFGARIAKGANVYSSVTIWYPPFLSMDEYATLGPRVRCYNQARIHLGAHATVSQDASLCAGTHDYNDPDFQLITRPINIGAKVWVAAEAFVGPGVTIGERAVLGARGVATRDLEPGTIYAGNPARPLKKLAGMVYGDPQLPSDGRSGKAQENSAP
jgi:putative colanic acid biosynthesis acetyltransferase WcaF